VFNVFSVRVEGGKLLRDDETKVLVVVFVVVFVVVGEIGEPFALFPPPLTSTSRSCELRLPPA